MRLNFILICSFCISSVVVQSYVKNIIIKRPILSSESSLVKSKLYHTENIKVFDVGQTHNNVCLYSINNRKFDDSKSNIESSWKQNICRKISRTFGTIIAALILSLLGSSGATARPPRSSNTNNSPQKAALKKNSNSNSNSNSATKVALQKKSVKKNNIVEIVVDQGTDRKNKQLSQIGYLLVGVSTVSTLFIDDSKKIKKNGDAIQKIKNTSASKNWKVQSDEDDEEEEKDDNKVNFKNMAATTSTIPKREAMRGTKGISDISNKLGASRRAAVNSLPPPEELFATEQESSDFFSDSFGLETIADSNRDSNSNENVNYKNIEIPFPVKKNKFSAPPSMNKKEKKSIEIKKEKKVVSSLFNDDNDENDIESTKPSPTTPLPTTQRLPPPPPVKKSIFDRIFQKQSSRPINLAEVIHIEDTATDFRTAVATTLTTYLPVEMELFPDVQIGGILAYSVDDYSVFAEEDKKVELLVSLQKDLLPKEAADAFADVTNAMLVSLTDRCVETLDRKDETETATTLDSLSDFAMLAASLFERVLPGMVIEDGGIKYNGKAQKNKLEGLFLSFLKGGMGNMAQMMGVASESNGEGKDSEAFDAATAEIEAEKRQGRMQCLVHIFSISEGKRNNLEQKAMKDAMMSMMGGGGGGMGGLGDLAGMMGNMVKGQGQGMNLGGGGKGMPDMDEATFQEMMKEAQEGAANGDIDPAQMEAMLSESLGEMKEQIKNGTVNKQNVVELEKQMGMGLKEMIGMIEMAKKMTGKQKVPEIDEMLSLFKQLLALKK